MSKVRYPAGNLLLRKLEHDFPVISHGKGMYLFDQEGKEYIDAVGGAFVASLGHGNHAIAERIAKQLTQVAYVNGTQFTSEAAETLASLLDTLTPTMGKTRSAFLSSGSEAVEAAIKFARQFHFDRGEHKRHKIIARTPGYHGNTLYALSASGRPHYKKVFGPLLNDVHMIDTPYPYRSKVENYDKEGADFYASQLEAAIQKEGKENVAAFLVEPVSGSSTGGSTPPPGYFEKIQEICQRNGILIIADEILCGSGRTGKFLASEHYQFSPDIVTLAKGINGGYAPLSAVIVKEEKLETLKKGSGGFIHAQTFMQAPCMAIAGVAVLEEIQKKDIIQNTASLSKKLFQMLDEKIKPIEHIGSVQGLGFLAGIEIVEDEKSKKPFDRSLSIAEKVVSQGLTDGIVLWPNVGHADGQNGDLLMIAPPLNSSENDLEKLTDRLKETLSKSLGKL